MDWTIWVLIAGGALILLGLGVFKLVPKSSKTAVMAIGGILLVVGGLPLFGVDYGAFSVTGTDEDTDTETVADTSSGTQRSITTFTTVLKEDVSGSRTAVNGELRFYESDVDLSDPNIAAIESVAVVSGVGTDTSAILVTDTSYRVVFVNGTAGNWYNEDLGIMSLSSNDWSEADGALYWSPDTAIVRMANITDPLNEATTNGDINGQTNVTAAASVEIQGDASPAEDEVLNYDESDGDGDFYLDIHLGATGANQKAKEMVLCFQGEGSGASPEGNELTSVSVQHQSGADLLDVGELVTYFNNEACVQLGDIAGGKDEETRLTITLTEANLDTNDDYKIIVDDLGDINGKAVLFSTGDSQEVIDMDAQA